MTRLVNPDTGEFVDVAADGDGAGPLDDPANFLPAEEITPRQAAMVMVKVQRLRRQQVKEVKRLRIDVARLTAVAEKAKARGQLEADGTVEDRKAKGRLASADAFFDVACAEAVAEAAYSELFILRDDWDSARTIAANERAEKNAIEGIGN